MLEKISNTLFIRKQKKILQKELNRLSEQYKLTRKFPEYGTSEDENAQEVEKIQENLSLQRNLKNLIRETKVALAKIDKNKYGICEDCEGQIEPGRLKAYPSASICITCATKKHRKK